MAANLWRSSVIAEAAANESTSKANSGYSRDPASQQVNNAKKNYKWDIVWLNVAIMLYFYIGGLYGMFLFSTTCRWPTIAWCIYLLVIGTLGATAGAHRLWTHKSYKAKLPLQILLVYFQTTCFQNHIYEWVRDHRVHHKFTDTDADPHNASRGLFFSHVGWLLVRKHADVREKGKTIYMKDLEADPVVMFQKKYYSVLMPLFCFVIPAVVPWYFWGESFSVAWYTASIFRYTLNVNGTWTVNSFAHIYGTRPYDKNILARENVYVGHFGFGEGWHNYHHVFPWDYKASEFNGYAANLTTGFIDLCAKIGWAYDLKSVSDEMIRKRRARTGVWDGREGLDDGKNCLVWGWDDKDMPAEDRIDAITMNCLKEFQ